MKQYILLFVAAACIAAPSKDSKPRTPVKSPSRKAAGKSPLKKAIEKSPVKARPKRLAIDFADFGEEEQTPKTIRNFKGASASKIAQEQEFTPKQLRDFAGYSSEEDN